MPKLTHLDPANRPTMVDVGAKAATFREASAEATVKLPAAVARELRRTGHRTKKGPVFDTAIVAGVMAAKKTHEIVPFCHPLPLERCTVDISDRTGGRIHIVCSVAVHHKTDEKGEGYDSTSYSATLSVLVPDICPCCGE